MDQQTANKLAVIDRVILGVIAIGSVASMVVLAAFRDGVFSTLLVQNLPGIAIASLIGVGGVSLGAGIVQAFQAKYSYQSQTQTTVAQTQAQAQTSVAQTQAQAQTTIAQVQAAAPAAPVPTEPQASA